MNTLLSFTPRHMDVLILIGLQGSGKSTFCKQYLADHYLRLNLDMLRTRHREKLLFEACLQAKQSCVIDNTNPTAADRARYLQAAKAAQFTVSAALFVLPLEDAMRRNQAREKPVPEKGLLTVQKQLQIPDFCEGFDYIWHIDSATQPFRCTPITRENP